MGALVHAFLKAPVSAAASSAAAGLEVTTSAFKAGDVGGSWMWH
jgi:hypothetical protein